MEGLAVADVQQVTDGLKQAVTDVVAADAAHEAGRRVSPIGISFFSLVATYVLAPLLGAAVGLFEGAGPMAAVSAVLTLVVMAASVQVMWLLTRAFAFRLELFALALTAVGLLLAAGPTSVGLPPWPWDVVASGWAHAALTAALWSFGAFAAAYAAVYVVMLVLVARSERALRRLATENFVHGVTGAMVNLRARMSTSAIDGVKRDIERVTARFAADWPDHKKLSGPGLAYLDHASREHAQVISGTVRAALADFHVGRLDAVGLHRRLGKIVVGVLLGQPIIDGPRIEAPARAAAFRRALGVFSGIVLGLIGAVAFVIAVGQPALLDLFHDLPPVVAALSSIDETSRQILGPTAGLALALALSIFMPDRVITSQSPPANAAVGALRRVFRR